MNKSIMLNLPDLSHKVIIVTGANSGIGYHTALELGLAKAKVILACRNLEKGQLALTKMQTSCPNGDFILKPLDLSDLNSIHKFVQEFLNQYTQLDILINNAGIMAIPKRTITKNGFEMQFGTNHLGHFALTGLLLKILIQTDRSRIVTVSSLAHKRGRINLKDLQSEKHYSPWGAYAQSKLANLLFAFELNRLFNQHNLSQTSLACHPGIAKTNIIETGMQANGKITFLGNIMNSLVGLVSQTDYAGALPTLEAATVPTINGDTYYGPDGFNEYTGMPKLVKAKPKAHDLKMAKNLWLLSQELTKVNYEFN